MRLRLDKLILERGLAPSRERAQAMLIAGRILVNGQKIEKARDAGRRGCGNQGAGRRSKIRQPWWHQAWNMLLQYWQIELKGKICADIGTSTGGFY